MPGNEEEVDNNQEELGNDSDVDTGEEELESANTGSGDSSEWQKKFKTPDDIYNSYKELQSEYTKVKQGSQERESNDEQVDLENLDIDEPENPNDVLDEIVQKNIDAKVGDVIQYVNEQRINYVISQVQQIFPDFDLEKSQESLSTELENFNDNYKKQHPVEAMVRAISHIKGLDVKQSDEGIFDKLKNFSESSSNRKPPQTKDEVDEIINSSGSSLPF